MIFRRQAPTCVVVRQREHRPGVALGEVAAREHPEHVLRQLEQADAVRDGRLGATDPLGHLSERQLELVYQGRVGPRLFDGGQVLAGDVLDEADEQRVAVVRVPHDGRDRRHSRLAGRTPTALAGDELVATVGPRAHDDGLQHALVPDRGRQPRGRLGLEAAARLARVRVHRFDGEVQQLGLAGSADQHLEAAA